MKRFDFAIAPKELAEAMMADLGNGPTTANGDRSSTKPLREYMQG